MDDLLYQIYFKLNKSEIFLTYFKGWNSGMLGLNWQGIRSCGGNGSVKDLRQIWDEIWFKTKTKYDMVLRRNSAIGFEVIVMEHRMELIESY